MRIKRTKWIEIGSWLFLLLFLFNIINYFRPWQQALIGSSFELFAIALMFYSTRYFLIPKFSHHQKNYLIISLTLLFGFSLIFMIISEYVLPKFGEIDKNKPPLIFVFIRFFTTFGFSYFVSTSIALMQKTSTLMKNEKVLTEEKLQTELKLLKAQINPHFIFNALNNIYSLAFLKSQQAPESILKLSEMLRYVFYDCSKDRVFLEAEINYINNFIAFQQMKSDHKQKIKMLSEIGTKRAEIAPMLLIPFIENSFKYSRVEEQENAFVDIQIQLSESHLQVSIENSVPKDNKVSSGSGMGIKNVSHRLQIIYPKKHTLKIEEHDERFVVLLNIEVNQKEQE